MKGLQKLGTYPSDDVNAIDLSYNLLNMIYGRLATMFPLEDRQSPLTTPRTIGCHVGGGCQQILSPK
jgi:hypothetical protein